MAELGLRTPVANLNKVTVTLPAPLGVSLTETSRQNTNRVVVTSIREGSPAVGLVQVGDIVASAAGIPANSLTDVVESISLIPPQSSVTLVLERDNPNDITVPTPPKTPETNYTVQKNPRTSGKDDVLLTGIYAEQDAKLSVLVNNFSASRKFNHSLASADHAAIMANAIAIVNKRSTRSAKSTQLILSVVKRLKRSNVPLTTKFYNIVMCALIQSGDAATAVDLFSDIETPNIECYTTLAKAYSTLRKPDNAIALLPTIRSRRLRPNIHTYNAIISACVRGGKLAKARRLFTDMLVDGVSPNAVSWNIIINWHVQQNKGPKRLGGALEAFADMKASGIKPNVVTFTTIMKAYAKSGMLNKAEEVFSEIKRVMPGHLDSGVYNTLIQAYSEKLEWRRCVELLDEMEGRAHVTADESHAELGLDEPLAYGIDGKVPPYSRSFSRRRPWLTEPLKAHHQGKSSVNLDNSYSEGPVVEDVTYCLTIRACANAGQVEKSRELFDRMMERGFYPPPSPAVVSLLSGYADAGRLGDCFEIFKSLKIWEVFPDMRMLSTVMHGCLAAGRAELALSVYSKLKSSGVGDDVVTGTLLARTYGVLGELENMFDVVRGMSERRGNETPTIVTFNTLIEWCIRHGNLNSALDALGMTLEAQKWKVRLNRQTFHELVGRVIPEVVEGPSTIKETTDVLVNRAYTINDSGKLEYLQQVLQKIRSAGAVPNGTLYRGLLLLCERCDRWDLGFDLVRERERGLFLLARTDLIAVRPVEDKFRARKIVSARTTVASNRAVRTM